MSTPRRSLVCQHLENVSRAAIEEYQRIVRAYVRGRQGIYALYRRNKLYYVGLASNLRIRLKHHLKDKHAESWDRFSVYLTIGDRHLKEREALVLRIMTPKGNRQKGRLKYSENLRFQLSRAIKSAQRREFDELFGRRAASAVRPPKPASAKLARYVTKPTPIKARYRDRMFYGWIRRDGRIRFRGRLYDSPSAAGAAARKRATNGWTFWQYQRAPGDWVELSKLR